MKRFLANLALLVVVCTPIFAQQGTTSAPPPAAQSSNPTSAPVAAPQVSLVLHRVSGFKMFTLLRRSGVRVAPLSDELLTKNAIQTSVAAGLILEDGSIVARLPRAELEVSGTPDASSLEADLQSNSAPSPPGLVVILRDGSEQSLRFVGLDGGTGLSLLYPEGQRNEAPNHDANAKSLTVGQRVRLLTPGRAPQASELTGNELYFVTIGEIVGALTGISLSASGNVTRLSVTAEKLSSASLGGIAVNDAGETIGIIEAINGKLAEVIPVAGVRRAVERIRLGVDSQSRPWLGARGSSIATVSREQLEIVGWKPAKAANLMARQRGVLLTSVPPQTPAWVAKLRVGDVVLRVNDGEVRSAEEFSLLLTQAGAKTPARFTIMRPGWTLPQVVSVKLEESLNPVLDMKAAEERAVRLASSDPLVARGLETLPITAKLANRLKVRGGRIVVFVHPSSSASNAGVLAGDIIEAVNGELLSENNLRPAITNKITLDVSRKGERIKFEIDAELVSPPRTQ